RVRAHNWSATPLGPLDSWPQSLRTATSLILQSPVPIVMLWGPEGVMIYNDAYSVFAGGRHPELLGSNVREGWPEVADFNDNVMKVGLAGGTLKYKDQELTLYRNGRAEQVWMNLDYSPVYDESGKPGGVIAIVVETTERVLADHRKAIEQERQRRLFEQAPGFIVIMRGSEHRVDFVNDEHRKLFGSGDWIGKTMRDAFPSIEGQGFFEALDEVFRTGRTIEFTGQQVRYRRGPQADEETRLLNFIYAPTYDERGDISGIFCEGFDITEQYRAQDALRASEERLRAATEAAELGTWDFNPVTGELRWDARCKELFGLPPDAEVTYEGAFLTGLHPDDRARTDEAVQAAISPQGSSSYDIEYRTIGLQDGVERWCAATGNALFEDGEATRFVGTIRDISEKKRAEERLSIVNKTGAQIAAEFNVDNIVQMITDAGVALTGAEFGAFFYNVLDDRGESYMLYALSGVPRENFSKFPMPRNTAVFAPTFSGEGVVRSDDILQDPRYGKNAPQKGMPDGHLPVRSYLAVPVISRSGEVQGGLFFGHAQPAKFTGEHESLLLGLAGQTATAIDNSRLYQALQRANDTLEHRVAEEIAERSKVEEALRQAQKMEAIGQLTGGIAHDFNNLLGAIGGSFSLIERRLADGKPGAERYIGAGQDAVRRAASLTQRLLAFSRRATLDPKPIDANKLILGMEELVRRSVGPNVEVEVVGQAGLWPTKVDSSQLESALLNLCINGRDAMAPGGGRLTIETANKWLDDRSAREQDLDPGQYISVCVTDTGAGMDADTIARAFDPFFTTKPIGQGTGLGLSMVYGFTRQSGGQVRIYSEIGKGTTMCLYLPRYVGVAEEKNQPIADTKLQSASGETVLIIDDEAILRMLVVDVLEEAGYRVLQAATGPEGLRVLQSDKHIDLLITDVGLPGGMNGRQVADAARVTRPALKVLFITGFAENAAVGNGHLEPGMIVVTKPFVITEFATKVRELIDSSWPVY
ncbi:MAG: PAS domain-containing protein, partial [Caulobacterales bacterium]